MTSLGLFSAFSRRASSAEKIQFPLAVFHSINQTLNRNMHRAVFLDRDGTIIEEKEYLHRPEEVVVFPGAGAALKRLQDAGFLLFIVTNQAGVGRGYFTMADVEKVHARLLDELGRDGVRFTKIYVAPEAPDQPNRGRKPSPQFLLEARKEFGIDLSQSYMIGDKLIDLECGWNAGVKKCFLVRTGYGAEWERKAADKLGPAVVVDGFVAAAEWITQTESQAHESKTRINGPGQIATDQPSP